MADAGTLSRIGAILKPTFAEGIKEQQQLKSDMRSRIGKPAADAWKAPGQYYQIAARVGGNRAGIMASQSDDALPPASRQKYADWQVYDRGYFGQVKLYEKDILNTSKGEFQAFVNTKTDEVKGITRDFLKVVNIDLSAGDGSGVLSLVAANTTASTTVTLQVGSGINQYGSIYLQTGDVVDFYDPTFTTSRTSGAGVSISSITPSVAGGPASCVVSTAVSLTANDVMIRGTHGPNKAYVGPLAMLRNQGLTFQGLSNTTYPLLNSNRIAANGGPLTESILQSMQDVVMRTSGEELDEYWAGMAQWAAYLALGFSQKRFETMKLDKGFDTLSYNNKKFVKFIDIPSSTLWGLNTDSVKFGEIAPWGPSNMDGLDLKPVQGYMAYYMEMREYGNMVYTQPNGNVLADGLSFDTSNPAYAR